MNPETLSKASISERFRAIWAWVLAIVILFALSANALIQASEAAKRREIAAKSLFNLLNDKSVISMLKSNVEKIKPFTKNQVVMTLECNPVISGNTKEVHTECTAVPIQAVNYVSDIYHDIDQLEEKLDRAKALLNSTAVVSSGRWWSAYAAEAGVWPANADKTNVMYAILILLFSMTGACFGTMLLSSNARAVTYSIDALKIFVGFYVGLMTSFFK
jgi:hypothetical protein